MHGYEDCFGGREQGLMADREIIRYSKPLIEPASAASLPKL